jgi:hypothetical protein
MPKNGKPVESTNDIVVAEGTYEGVNVKFEDDTSWYVKCTNDGCNNATAQNKVGVNKVNHPHPEVCPPCTLTAMGIKFTRDGADVSAHLD